MAPTRLLLASIGLSLFWFEKMASCSGPPISLMEMMVDLFIAFQATAPVNKKNLKKKHGHCSHIAWDQRKYTNHLPSKE